MRMPICIDTSDKASIVYLVIRTLPIDSGGPLYIGSRMHVGGHARRKECACVIPGTRRTCAGITLIYNIDACDKYTIIDNIPSSLRLNIEEGETGSTCV